MRKRGENKPFQLRYQLPSNTDIKIYIPTVSLSLLCNHDNHSVVKTVNLFIFIPRIPFTLWESGYMYSIDVHRNITAPRGSRFVFLSGK